MTTHSKLIALASLFLVACVSLPSGPSIMALPGTGKSFEQFRNDDSYCQQFAYQQIGGETPNQAAVASGAGTAIVGAGLGAAAGAAIGGGQGALIGAGTGLAAGGLVGTDAAGTSGYYAQQRYDMSYIQCMYGQGHRVPVSGQLLDSTQQDDEQNDDIPPPAGAPPPPPPW
jgi:hypothetical protein